MQLKQGVGCSNLQPQLLLGLLVAEDFFSGLGKEMVVTSLNDGEHSYNSLHYAGCAADLRTKHLPLTTTEKHNLAGRISMELGPDFDCIFEYGGQPREHIHLEYQPKRRISP